MCAASWGPKLKISQQLITIRSSKRRISLLSQTWNITAKRSLLEVKKAENTFIKLFLLAEKQIMKARSEEIIELNYPRGYEGLGTAKSCYSSLPHS